MKTISKLAFSVIAACVASTASAQFAKPEDAIKYRKAVFTVQGAAMGAMGAMNAGRVPFNAASMQANANVVATMSALPWAAFGPGTEGGRAKSEIWSDAAGFKSAIDRFQAAAANFDTVAKAGNPDAIKTAFGALGASCKNCHDSYQAK